MRYTPVVLANYQGSFRHLKAPSNTPSAQRDPKVIETVSRMLSDIQARGMDAVLDYARRLDHFEGRNIELSKSQIENCGSKLSADLRSAIELGSQRTQAFALATRDHLTDFELEQTPGVITGVHYIPVERVGAYLPAGRFPLTSSALMTVGVAKVAGVPSVIACTPPQPDGGPNNACLYSAYLSGVDRVFLLGGVQALAAMAFGLLDDKPINMLVGAGNAYVAEAKRQLFGTVAIDLLAGPSEVAIIADETADPDIVAADLLGQAEHGPDSPAALITTSEKLGHAVIAAVEEQIAGLSTAPICGPAWRDYGVVTFAEDRETAAALMDDLAPEHLEIITADDDWYFQRLQNYGSLFIGTWSAVTYSDKGMAGTNHTLPTAGGAKHSAGLSVSRFLKPLTYQRVTREATPECAIAVKVMSESEGLTAHAATAIKRLATYEQT